LHVFGNNFMNSETEILFKKDEPGVAHIF